VPLGRYQRELAWIMGANRLFRCAQAERMEVLIDRLILVRLDDERFMEDAEMRPFCTSPLPPATSFGVRRTSREITKVIDRLPVRGVCYSVTVGGVALSNERLSLPKNYTCVVSKAFLCDFDGRKTYSPIFLHPPLHPSTCCYSMGQSRLRLEQTFPLD